MPIELYPIRGREMIASRGINITLYYGPFPQELDGNFGYTAIDGKQIEIKTKTKSYSYLNSAPEGKVMVEQILGMIGANIELVRDDKPVILYADVTDGRVQRTIELIQKEFGINCFILQWRGGRLPTNRIGRVM